MLKEVLKGSRGVVGLLDACLPGVKPFRPLFNMHFRCSSDFSCQEGLLCREDLSESRS